MNYENRNKLVAVLYGGAAVALVGGYTINYVKTVREERAKRRKIEANLQKSLGAIGGAYSTVAKRLLDGEYDRRANPIGDMMMDLEFEQIIEFNKE